MGTLDIRQTTTTGLTAGVSDYSVDYKTLDAANGQGETYWYNPSWSEYLGYYKSIPELKKAVDALSCWTAGKGYITDTRTKVILEHISGWGEDTFDSIMQGLIVTKKINGDAFAEIIEEEGVLINIKPLNPSSVRIVVNPKGIIIRYDIKQSSGIYTPLAPEKVLHLCNDRIASEIHGTSVIEACKWVIDARNEAMVDWRRILHRSTIRVMYIDMDDTDRLAVVREQYKDAIKNGEVLIIPAKKGEAELVDVVAPPLQPFLEWIRYLENFFYQAVGIPKVILGGAAEYTEASSKVGYLTFEQVYMAEQRLLEQDLWNQLAIKLTFDRPVSLKEAVQGSEAANTGQLGFQQNEMQTGVTRNE